MKLSDLIIIDTETTGNGDTDRLCQLAWKYHHSASGQIFNALYKPPVPISYESMSVHHITPEMVADRPLFTESEEYDEVRAKLQQPAAIWVAHNASFDIGMMEKEGVVPPYFIDTLKLVRHFDPDMIMQRHNLQYLRYLLKLDDVLHGKIQPHDALSDVLITEALFDRLYAKAQQEYASDDPDVILRKLVDLSSGPVWIGRFAFGKYKGQKVREVASMDRGYLEWLLGQKRNSEQDETDWIYTLETVLNE